MASSVSAFAPSFGIRKQSITSSLSAVTRKDSYDITLLSGDGIGPEITESTKQVLEALCKRMDFKLNLNNALIGGAAIDAVNDPFPEETLKQCQESDSILLACIGGFKVCILLWIMC
jgi:3-isopropylmalate dehydrogenase